jgi:hypothetical protein
MRIVFRYLAMQDIVDFALATLRERSPVGAIGDKHPGLYRDSHMVFLNGHVVEGSDVSAWRPGDQINISNPVPYARKIEMGRGKMSVPGHVYEDTALIVAGRYGNRPRSSSLSCRSGSAACRPLRRSRVGSGLVGACQRRRVRIGWCASRRWRSGAGNG